MEEFSAQLTTAIVSSQLLEWLKSSRWFPFLNEWSSGRWQKFIAALAALLTSLGIGYTIDYNFMDGGKLIFTIPSASILLHMGWDFFKQYALQEFAYQAGFKKADKPINVIGG